MTAMIRNVNRKRTLTYGFGNTIATKRWVLKSITQKQNAMNTFHNRNKERN